MRRFPSSRPLAWSLDYLMFWTDKTKIVDLRHRLGRRRVIAGSLAYALATRKFRWKASATAEDTGMHMIGVC
jgi:hypothetical protein